MHFMIIYFLKSCISHLNLSRSRIFVPKPNLIKKYCCQSKSYLVSTMQVKYYTKS
jgi:hypothetical protein